MACGCGKKSPVVTSAQVDEESSEQVSPTELVESATAQVRTDEQRRLEDAAALAAIR